MSEILRTRLGLNTPKEFKVKPNAFVGVDPTLLFGVELEIENLERDEEVRMRRAVAGMQYHKDGSLRNNGGEFVTLPMNYSALADTLTRFFKADHYDAENYSERCSVHVHANCQDLTAEQVRLVVCLYQILEKILFNYIGADRDKNIFCVPLGECVMASKLLTSDDVLLGNASRKWRKYTALNLLPLYTQGTIEFRHMAGTCDVNFILQWCEIIGSMFKYARDHKFEDVVKSLMDLNTSSAYATFMQDIFQGSLYDVLAVGPYREHLEDGVINMKVMLASPQKETREESLGEALLRQAEEIDARGRIVPQPPQPIEAAPVGWENAMRAAQQWRPDPPQIQAQHPGPVLTALQHTQVTRENMNRRAAGMRPMTNDQIIRFFEQRQNRPRPRRVDGGI